MARHAKADVARPIVEGCRAVVWGGEGSWAPYTILGNAPSSAGSGL